MGSKATLCCNDIFGKFGKCGAYLCANSAFAMGSKAGAISLSKSVKGVAGFIFPGALGSFAVSEICGSDNCGLADLALPRDISCIVVASRSSLGGLELPAATGLNCGYFRCYSTLRTLAIPGKGAELRVSLRNYDSLGGIILSSSAIRLNGYTLNCSSDLAAISLGGIHVVNDRTF